MSFNKGEILEATNRSIDAGLHYIVYLEQTNGERFIGAMLTGSSIDKNEFIPNKFFISHSEAGEKFKIPRKKTHLVKAKLIKLEAWGPFTVVGRLTAQGLELVLSIVDQLQPETWEEYLRRTN